MFVRNPFVWWPKPFFVPEASNSVANSSVCCFGSECLVRNRIALCMGKSDNGIAVCTVLRRKEFQKRGKRKLQNNRRLPCATCTYEQTCVLLPFVHGHLSDLVVKCDIESMSEPFANGPLPVSQLEAPSIWIGNIRSGFKFLNPCSKTCRWQFDMLPLCLWIRLFSVNPMGFYCFLISGSNGSLECYSLFVQHVFGKSRQTQC